jgi:CRISPR/Cas system-associated exonuclease Cas4 (RecB family)
LKIKKIKSLSPSKYFRFKQCQLSELWSLSRNEAIVPVHANAVLGTVIHNVLECFSKDKATTFDDFEKIWTEIEHSVIEKQSSPERYSPLNISSTKYFPKKQQTKKAVQNLISNKKNEPSFEGKCEEPMNSLSGKIFGKADLLIRKYETNEISLIDFKTGKILDRDGNIKEEYVLQLKLYAILYNHNYRKIFDAAKEWPDHLLLIGNDGTKYPIEYSKVEAVDILNEIETTIDAINNTIDLNEVDMEEEFSTVGPHCSYCTFRSACKKYLLASEENNDIIDVVKSVRKSANGEKLVIKFETNTSPLHYFLISESDKLIDTENLVGKKCIVTNINKQNNETFNMSSRFSVLKEI